MADRRPFDQRPGMPRELAGGTRYDLAVAALGGHGELVTRAADLKPALQRALGMLRLLGCVAAVAGVLPGLARLLVETGAQLAVRTYPSVEDALRELGRG